jgi:agmatine/peptidylarginine deiminase
MKILSSFPVSILASFAIILLASSTASAEEEGADDDPSSSPAELRGGAWKRRAVSSSATTPERDDLGGPSPSTSSLEEHLALMRDWAPPRRDDEGELPIGLTAAEEEEVRKRMASRTSTGAATTTSPPENPQLIPEWAPMHGVLIRYPLGISVELVRSMSEVATIYVLVSKRRQAEARVALRAVSNNVEWIVGDTDSYWTRDYGPWFVTVPGVDDASGGLAVVNHEYNRPRPNDNQAPLKVAQHLRLPYYDSGLTHCGGNVMVDGRGQAVSTHIAYTETPQCGTQDDASVPLESCEHVDDVVRRFYGVTDYHVVADPTNTYIDHVDTWAKYLSPSTILIRQVSTNHPQYDEIERVVTYFETTAKTSDGDDWNIVRIWTDSDQPYTNSLILNDRVYVPIVGSASDDDALAVYRDAMPGYTVLGFTGTWESTDALHCRVKGIPQSLPARSDCAPCSVGTIFGAAGGTAMRKRGPLFGFCRDRCVRNADLWKNLGWECGSCN